MDFHPGDYPLSILTLWWKQNNSAHSHDKQLYLLLPLCWARSLCQGATTRQTADITRGHFVESRQIRKRVHRDNNQERVPTEGSLQIVEKKDYKMPAPRTSTPVRTNKIKSMGRFIRKQTIKKIAKDISYISNLIIHLSLFMHHCCCFIIWNS